MQHVALVFCSGVTDIKASKRQVAHEYVGLLCFKKRYIRALELQDTPELS